MSDISALIQTLNKLDDRLAACSRCGLCQSVCPVFGETYKESDVTRGKLALLNNLAHKMIEDVEAVSERINRCLLCGSCESNCPAGVSILEIFIEARRALASYKGMKTIKKLIFRNIISHPLIFNAMLRGAAPFQSLVMQQHIDGSYSVPFLEKYIGTRRIKKLPTKSLHAECGYLNIPSKNSYTVLFYPGCMADKYYTNVGKACIKVLKHLGVGIVMPTGYTCCGIAALASGEFKGFLMQTKKNLKAITKEILMNDIDYIVTPCGTCTGTMKNIWPYYMKEFHEVHQETIEYITPRIMDINAFLVDVLKVEQLPLERMPIGKVRTVTFHDSCHLKKGLGVASQPRKLIGMNPNYKLVEMAEADRCCGCGGSFTLAHYDLSKKIGQRKLDNIVNSGAEVVATGCPACMMQLTDMLSKSKDKVKVKHSIEIYADSLPD